MLSTQDISQRIDEALDKRVRLVSMLNRHRKMLEKKQREFTLSYGLNPESCNEDLLAGNDQAYWDYFSITSKKNKIAEIEKKILQVDERVESLKAAYSSFGNDRQDDSREQEDDEMEL